MKIMVSRREIIPYILLLQACLLALLIYFPHPAVAFFQLFWLAIPAAIFLLFKKLDPEPFTKQRVSVLLLFVAEICGLAICFNLGEHAIPLLLQKTLLQPAINPVFSTPGAFLPWGTIAVFAGLIAYYDRRATKRVLPNQLYAPLLKTTNEGALGLTINIGMRFSSAVAMALSVLFLILLALPTLSFSSLQNTLIAVVLIVLAFLFKRRLRQWCGTANNPLVLFCCLLIVLSGLIWLLHSWMGVYGETHKTHIPAFFSAIPLWEQSYFLTLFWSALWIPWISFYVVIRARQIGIRAMLIVVLIASALISALLNAPSSTAALHSPLWAGIGLLGLCVFALYPKKTYHAGIDGFLVNAANSATQHPHSAQRFWVLVFLHPLFALVLTLIYGSVILFCFGAFYGILQSLILITLPTLAVTKKQEPS